MKFLLDDVMVYFPFKLLYNEQKEYMAGLKKILDQGGKGIIEMPTGTGKTASLLSFILSYQLAHPTRYRKLIYCTRTFNELEKTLKELQLVVEYIKNEFDHAENQKIVKEVEAAELAQANKEIENMAEDKVIKKGKRPGKGGIMASAGPPRKTRVMTGDTILALGMSARRALCIHPEVSKYTEREKVDAECFRLTSRWNRAENEDNPDMLCTYFENLETIVSEGKMPPLAGVYTLDDLKAFGRKEKVCPYYLARKAVREANVIVCNYPYLIDSGVQGVIMGETEHECVVVFDEAHNIDNLCIDALTIKLNKGILESASRHLEKIKDKASSENEKQIANLKDEYNTLVSSLRDEEIKKTQLGTITDKDFAEAIPGSIRKAEHFLSFLRRILTFLKTFLKIKDVRILSSEEFLTEIERQTLIDKQTLGFCQMRFRQLVNTLEIVEIDEMTTLTMITEFMTLLSQYTEGFKIILEPYQDASSVPDPLLQFCCLDASIALKPVLEKYKALIMTSGTISPLTMYPKMLGFEATLLKSVSAILPRNSIAPMVICKGNDQVSLTSEFSERGNQMVVRNYGNLLVELSKVVPDGIVVFFPSYGFMKDLIVDWNQKGILEEILKNKLIFVETKDIAQTTNAMSHFRDACRSGRGAIFLSVARGKVAEGVDFKNYLGRCVVIIGIPFQYSKSKPLLCRMEYVEKKFGISNKDFLTFDAMRQCSQCLGRVIRSKSDYGLMILADRRFSKDDKVEKLPEWIQARIEPGNRDLQMDIAIQKAKIFFRQMGQPVVLTPELYFNPQDAQKEDEPRKNRHSHD